MSFLRNLSPRPNCSVCGEPAPTGSTLCLRHRNPNAPQQPSNPSPAPSSNHPTCLMCSRPALTGQERCQTHQQFYIRYLQSMERYPVKGPFRRAFIFGAGFMLGAFLMSIPIFIVFVMLLPSIMEFVFEAFREGMSSGR